MNQPARLSSSLIARKGLAQPVGRSTPAALAPAEGAGFGTRRRALLGSCLEEAPCVPVERLPAHVATLTGGAGEPPKSRRIALTVRLDPSRHTKLRILAARRDCTSRDLMLEALDRMLDAAGETCACLRECSSISR